MSDVTNSAITSSGLPSYEAYLNETKTRVPVQDLGRTEFLQLLAAQLRYQDPMEPQKDTDFIAQMAQMNSLQQLEDLNSVMSTFQYYNLVGQYVYAEEIQLETGDWANVHGLVDRVITQDGTAYVQIGDVIFPASKITQVYDKDLMVGGSTLLDTASLIGREVKAVVFTTEKETDEETGEETEKEVKTEVTGTVTRVALEDGALYAYLDGDDKKKVLVSSIVDIKEKPPVGTTDTSEIE